MYRRINITASHNPPEYNGYKVYWEDGAQITPPHDKGIMAEVKAITDFSTLKTMQEDNARVANLFEIIGGAIDDAYIAELKKQVKNQDAIDEMQDQLTIVYTPLHGTGNVPARRVLKELGFTHVYVVPEQELPDGEFPTVSYPNPEAAEAFELALALAKEKRRSCSGNRSGCRPSWRICKGCKDWRVSFSDRKYVWMLAC